MTDTLETIYENLAEALDQIDPADTNLFLSKLALTMGHQLGDAALVQDCIATAMHDLEFSRPSVSLSPVITDATFDNQRDT